jgi:hypothetical protein
MTHKVNASAAVDESFQHYVLPLERAFVDAHDAGKRTPRYLHHYTSSAEAVINVVSTGLMYAGDALFMNDSSELSYGATIIRDSLRTLTADATGPRRKFLDAVATEFEKDKVFFDVYVTCFCATAESLAHWQAYARQGEGYDLVFKTRSLEGLDPLVLVRVEYDPKKQQRTILRLVEEAWGRLQSDIKAQTTSARQAETMWVRSLTFALLSITPFYKDPRFRLEREWRLVKKLPAREKADVVKFRPSGAKILPYVEFQLRRKEDDAKTLPLYAIRYIDVVDDGSRRRSLHMLLRRHGLARVEVEPSYLPLRSR